VEESVRDHSGKFKAGKSGNPGGRPKTRNEFVLVCQSHSAEAAEVILDVMRGAQRAQERTKAAELILAYAYGRPATEKWNDESTALGNDRLSEEQMLNLLVDNYPVEIREALRVMLMTRQMGS